MEQYIVTGMTCAACQARVEKAVSKVEGVTGCSVSLLTNSMGVEGNASAQAVIEAVKNAGYGASLKTDKKASGAQSVSDMEESLRDKETPLLAKRLTVSLIFLAALMYLSMGHMMWGWPLPENLADNYIAQGLIQLLLTVMIMVVNQRFFVSGFKSVMNGAPNMDTLVALGSGAAFVYSVYALFAMTDAQMHMDAGKVIHCLHEFYFESAAMILTLITVGKMLEAHSKGKTTNALKSLMKLAAKTAVVLVDGQETEVPIEKVKTGDIFVVRPGENIPVDGVIVEGGGAINESALTGESIPVDKAEGDSVSAATTNMSGFLKCRATRVGEDTTLSQIIQMVESAAATKAPIAKIADKVSGIFVPTVMTIALITVVVWLLTGADFGYALARGISVLVISCPCALGLATPVAIMVGNGVGAKNGIMFKTAVSLEQTGKMEIVALDKTGTITVGEPEVTDIICADGVSESELITLAKLLESKSEHPLAKAVSGYDINHEKIQRDQRYDGMEAVNFKALPGNGLEGQIGGRMICGGNGKFIRGRADVPSHLAKRAEELAAKGKTPMYFAADNRLLGIIAVADKIKEDSPQAVAALKKMGMYVVMITGDNEKSAETVGKTAGVDEVIAGVLPDGKEREVARLKKKGRVIMVGDGINDAPALAAADMGIAIGAGADVAIDAADVVLMKSRLSDVAAAIRLSRRTLTNIHENLFWAFFYNCIGIPLAAGVFIPIFGWTLNPMFGAAAMSLSSFCVVTNALRLNLVKVYDASLDAYYARKNKRSTIENNKKEEVNVMTKTMKIEGMMCGHCEARVRKALEAIDGVAKVEVSHSEGTAVLTLAADIDNDTLTKAVEEQDYKVLSVC